MPKQKRAKQELDSLIPTIKSEEKRLEDLLVEARARAEGMVRDAEAQAAARIQAARQALPGNPRGGAPGAARLPGDAGSGGGPRGHAENRGN